MAGTKNGRWSSDVGQNAAYIPQFPKWPSQIFETIIPLIKSGRYILTLKVPDKKTKVPARETNVVL